jgi:non-haem Fe2+, alpha-ketoglutarate-dependent halogenase
MQQDLSFQKIRNANPRVLTSAQIDSYNLDGFISPLDLFSNVEAEANRAYFDSLLQQVPKSGAYSINCYQARCEGIWDLCNDPRILDLVQDLIGPNVICWASHFFCKMPFDPKKVPWHQDASFWKLSPARTVTVWLAIDDADAENAAMRFIPGTHVKGHLDIAKSGEDSVLRLQTEGADQMGEPFSNVLKAGQVSLHADMLVHGSLPNASDRRRCGLTLRYCPPEVQFTDEGWAANVEPIICRGNDISGRWRHHARPVGNDVSLENSPHNIGGN